jgi:hypothetical protein
VFLPLIVSAKSCSTRQHFKCKSSAVGSPDLKRSAVNMTMLAAPMGIVCILTGKLKSTGFELSDIPKDWRRYLVVSSRSTCHLHDSRTVGWMILKFELNFHCYAFVKCKFFHTFWVGDLKINEMERLTIFLAIEQRIGYTGIKSSCKESYLDLRETRKEL